jgi:hypothetical protein
MSGAGGKADMAWAGQWSAPLGPDRLKFVN